MFKILIFPEGTNLTADTISKSNKFAADHNLAPYTQVLHPRVTGFIHVFNEMNRNKMIDCIHDVTVAYRGGEIPENELKFVSGALPDEIHFYIDVFEMEQIFENKDKLSNDECLEKWLGARWKTKEEFLIKYVNIL